MIRGLFVFVCAAVLGLFIQACLIHSFATYAPAPDFLMILVVFLALHSQTVWGLIGAFLLGVLADFASARFLGPNGAAYLLVFLLVGVIAARIFADRIASVIVITLIGSLCKSLVVISFYYIFTKDAFNDILHVSIFRNIFSEALLSALFAPVVFKLLTLAGGQWLRWQVGGSAGSYSRINRLL